MTDPASKTVIGKNTQITLAAAVLALAAVAFSFNTKSEILDRVHDTSISIVRIEAEMTSMASTLSRMDGSWETRYIALEARIRDLEQGK